MQPTTPKQIIVYADEGGREPFTEWRDGLRDAAMRRRIIQRILRLAEGNYGDVAPVGDGVSELRFFFGSGYRVYFGEENNRIVVLLCGGDKSSQNRDIQAAKAYWKEYKSHAKFQNL